MAFNFEEFVKKYEVHPETVNFLQARAADGVKPYPEIGVHEARKTSIAAAEKYGGTIDFDGTEEEITVPSPACKDGIPVSIYKPTACGKMEAPTLLVYFHGGGNVVGCRKAYTTVCKIMARDCPCIVLNVEYRLGPEHKFPANNDDVKCVVDWVAANKAAVGGASGSKVGVSGDSAGGRLAAVVCHESPDVIDFAVLIYPNVSMGFEHPSVEEFLAGPVLSWTNIQWFMSQYITEEDKTSPRASVILNKSFAHLPPTLILVAHLDPLRDGCYAYHDQLKDAGVKVELVTVMGVPHAFWSLPVAYKEKCREAHGAAVKFIQRQTAA